MTNYLPPQKTIELMAALVEAGQCTPQVRDALLAGVHGGFVAMLPLKNTAFDQIWTDLNGMNGVSALADQQVPLLIWLQNAADRLKTAGHPQEAVFQQAAAAVAAESLRRLQVGGTAVTPPVLPVYLIEIQKEYREYLARFLWPFEMTLRFTRSVFEQLRDSREMMNLEYHPGRLQEFYTNLPIGDPRRELWKTYVDLLQQENSKAVGLVETNYGYIVLPEFRQACDAYLGHAKQWRVVWDALLAGHSTLPGPLASAMTLYAPQFPPALEQALAHEIAEVSHRAGLT